jgi:hypothetical protein
VMFISRCHRFFISFFNQVLQHILRDFFHLISSILLFMAPQKRVALDPFPDDDSQSNKRPRKGMTSQAIKGKGTVNIYCSYLTIPRSPQKTLPLQGVSVRQGVLEVL